MQTQAKLERMTTRGKGGRPQTVLGIANLIRQGRVTPPSTRREENITHSRDRPVQDLNSNGLRQRKKGEPKQLELKGGGIKKVKRRGTQRGQPKGRRRVAVGTVMMSSFSSSSDDVLSDGTDSGGGVNCSRSEVAGVQDDIPNISEHLEAMTLTQIVPAADEVTQNFNITFHPPSASTPNRVKTQYPHSHHLPLNLDTLCTQNDTRNAPNIPLHPAPSNPRNPAPSTPHHPAPSTPHHPAPSSAMSAKMLSDNVDHLDTLDYSRNLSTSSDYVLAECTPSDCYHCGVFCALRGTCNH